MGLSHHLAMRKRKQFRLTFIRQWRKHRELTLEQLADVIDYTPSHLSMLERGERGYTQETLEDIADALHTDVSSLLTRDPGEPEDIWPIWRRANPAQRGQLVEIAKTLVKPTS